MKETNLMQSPTPFVFALVSLNDPHRFSTILVFISSLKYPITDVSLKTLLTVLMEASCKDLYIFLCGGL